MEKESLNGIAKREPSQVRGRIHSFQSLGTVDGPGVRSVVFFQGCPLRCHCCHNPDTWDMGGGKEVSAGGIFDKIRRYTSYYGKEGGVTLSGGEVLMQADFAIALLTLCRSAGIHCALDTSGCVITDKIRELVSLCDLVLMDYKYTNPVDYKRYTGMEQSGADAFLELLEELGIATVIRHVVIPTVNDDPESIAKIKALRDKYSCVTGIEFLPFRKLCVEKYRQMGISFPFEHVPECSQKNF